jgi:acyl-coenzyme A synthetase/AMP-(fatty) acid ligase
MNVTEPLRRIARLNPNAVAIIRAGGSSISYGLLDHAIDRMAGYASRLGLKPGDIASLTIAGPDESLGLTLMLAFARIGVASAEPSVPPGHTALRFCCGPSALPGHVAFDPGWMPNQPAGPDYERPAIHSDPDAVLGVFPSSGTTGRPKHIVITHRQMMQRVLLRWVADGAAPATRIVGIGLGCAWGVESVLRTLLAGGTLVLSNPGQAAADIARHSVTSIVTTPVGLRTLLELVPPGAGPFASLDSVQVGGSLLPPALYGEAVARLTPNIHSTMGSSEAAGFVSAPMRDLFSRPGAVGFIWPGVEVQALDEAGQPLAAGREGVLRIRSGMTASGYLAEDGIPSERFVDGWFHSGDIGTVWPDGMLTITGRTTDVINAGGVKVHPQVIESVLLKLPTVLDAAAFGVPDAMGVTRIWAAIVARSRIDDAVLNAFCRHALPGIAPQTILQIKALPRNENGKVMREQLVDIGLHAIRQPAEAAAARS